MQQAYPRQHSQLRSWAPTFGVSGEPSQDVTNVYPMFLCSLRGASKIMDASSSAIAGGESGKVGAIMSTH